ncbi:transposase [Labilibaculum sp.]|uniref:transposase n=1 Tax=Labilibaculum sp. TaxID=2060723 RepID=UPI0035691582
MEPKNLLTDEILKQFKTGKQLNDFLQQVQKRGIKKMLEGELDDHLGYEKHEKIISQNSRNGYGTKKVRTSLGESEIIPTMFKCGVRYIHLSVSPIKFRRF